MSVSDLRFIKRCAEFVLADEVNKVPKGTRGLYVLLNIIKPVLTKNGAKQKFDVVYIGMARGLKGGVQSRLQSHRKKKKDLWTHFSVYEVWDNITETEVAELEGLFRHIYRRDPQANRINQQRSFRKTKKVRQNNLLAWK